jgi:hypothetical protein
MNKNYVSEFRLDNGIFYNGEIKLLNHKYSNYVWLVNDMEIYSAFERNNNLIPLTYTNDSDVMAGLLNGTIEFEKVKEYKRIVLASAVNRLSDGEKIFIKIKNRYNPTKYIEVSKGLVEVGYNDCEDCCFEILQSPHKKINNLAFYKEV